MLYMVEMNFTNLPREADWNEWYSGHLRKLLAFPGFHAVQRLRAEEQVRSPYLAVYEVDGPEVFETEPYRTRAGRNSTGEWKEMMFDWHRNLFDGLREIPVIGADSRLLVVDRANSSQPALPAELTPLQCVGLDRTVIERGVAVLSLEASRAVVGATALFSRVFKPMMTVTRNASGRARA